MVSLLHLGNTPIAKVRVLCIQYCSQVPAESCRRRNTTEQLIMFAREISEGVVDHF